MEWLVLAIIGVVYVILTNLDINISFRRKHGDSSEMDKSDKKELKK